MAKRLIGINTKTGQLSSFDGASWSTIGGSYPSNVAITSAKAVFSFRGKLYEFIVNTSTQDFEIYEVTLSGPTYTLIANSDIASYASNSLSTVSNVVNYKDGIYIMVWIGASGTTNGIVISFNGTTITQVQMNLFSQSGAGSMSPVGGPYGVQASFYGNAITSCGDKLLCGPKHSICLGVTFGSLAPIVSDRLFTVDFSALSVGVGLLSQIGNSSGINQLVNTINGSSSTPTLDEYAFVTNSVVGFGSYKNKPYIMCLDGRCYELDQGGVRTLKFDIRDPITNPERTVTTGFTSNGPLAGTATIKMTAGIAATMLGLGPQLLGSKILITSGDQAGTVGIIVNAGGASATQEGYYATNLAGTSFISTLSTGVTFTTYKGLGVPSGQTSYGGNNISAVSAGILTTCVSQEMNGCLYMMVAGRSLLSSSVIDNTVNPSQIIKWDGVTATYYSLKFGGRYLNCWGCNTFYDQTANLWHIFFYDVTSDQVNHIAWDGNNDSIRLFASPFSLTASSDLGPSDGMVCGFNDSERSVDISGTSFSFAQQKNTITVKCFSVDSAAFNIRIRYNNFNAWTLATIYQVDGQSPGVGISNPGIALALTSSPTGVTHTIVHDIASDLPTYDGAIQYEITPLFD